VLGTNDVDARVRPHSGEELDFLAARVAGRYVGSEAAVSYDDVEKARSVLLVGFEPEEESPILFLRLRKAVRRTGTRVFTVAPFRSPGAVKTAARLLQTVPGGEAAALNGLLGATEGVAGEAAAALQEPGAVVLVGERLAASPGAYSAAARLADGTGAQLAWVPRRAGERGAVDAGALPTLLPGGRRVADVADRSEVGAVWGAGLPDTPGRDLTGILTAVRDNDLQGLLVGAVDPADCPDPYLALDALDAAQFVVSLEIRRSPVTDRADVVLPVAPAVEKSGTFLDWEGRARPFDTVLRQTGALPDVRVLHLLADQMGVSLGLPDVPAARTEISRLGAATERPPAPAAPAAEVPVPGAGEAVLASWHWLLDDGSLQDGEPFLAGTAKKPRLHLSAATATEIGAVDGAPVTVSSDRGSVTLPLVVADLPDRVVWVPMRTPEAAVRRDLAVLPGSVVRLSLAEGAVAAAGVAGSSEGEV